jgi:tetratricopeptide (TPR) repeat protein
VHLALQQPTEAAKFHQEALALSTAGDDRYEGARALAGDAAAQLALGRTEDARSLWKRSLSVYTSLQVPEADEVRHQLADLGA